MSDTTETREHWTARHGKPIIFVILTLIAVGVYLAFTIPVSVFPSTDFPRIVIGADNGVAPIDQMLVTVTRPIEEAVNSVQGLERVKSTTSRGSAEVDLYFSWDVDMFQTLARVNAAMARVQSTLPATARLTANPLTFAAFPIMGYSLTSNTIPQTRLWELATYELKPRLNRLNGVATVVVQGGQEPEFEIRPDPPKMLAAAVTIPGMLDAVRRSNLIDSPGLIESNHQLILSLVSGQARSPDELSQIAVKTTNSGVPVRIGDIAAVVNSVRPVYTIVTANGKPAVLLNINRQPVSNTVTVADEVHAEIAAVQKTLPRGVELRPFYDQSEIVNDSIKSVRDAILIGLVLASIIWSCFCVIGARRSLPASSFPLRSRSPSSHYGCSDESFNLMTLGGLAAAVGLVIDDAIVVVENIVLHRDAGQSRSEAIRSAIREISGPLVGSTVTPIVVFLPLISITGVTGVFFRALAITVGIALLTSLFLALTWTPALSRFLLRRPSEGRLSHEDAPSTGLLGAVIRVYERILRGALAHPILLTALLLVLVADPTSVTVRLAPICCPRWMRADLSSTTSCPRGRRSPRRNRVISRVEEILRAESGSREHVAANRSAAWTGAGHGSEHRRHRGEAETGSQAERRGSHLRGPRKSGQRVTACSRWNSCSCCRT